MAARRVVARRLPVRRDMADALARIVENVVGRFGGPLEFRFLLQPAMVVIVAIKAGIRDARLNRPAYVWAVVSDPLHRRALLRDGWTDLAKIFGAAVLLDVVYQIIAFRWLYPGEAVFVAVLLAVVPYVAIRGPVCRIVRRSLVKHQIRS